MDSLATHLALHGVLVLGVSVLGGWLLYRSILNRGGGEAAWHLLHAGGSVRGVMLIALAGVIQLPDLPHWQLAVSAWLIILFTWTSVLAMAIAAASGERGLRFTGSIANRTVYLLYAVGVIAIVPAGVLLTFGLAAALRAM